MRTVRAVLTVVSSVIGAIVGTLLLGTLASD
jgi:hypothetical protein